MFKYINYYNFTILCLILTQQWVWTLLLVVSIMLVEYLLLGYLHSLVLGSLVIIAAFIYGVKLSHTVHEARPEQIQFQAIVTQINAKQHFFQQYTVADGLQRWQLNQYGVHKQLQLGECAYFTVKPKTSHRLKNPFQLFENAMHLPSRSRATILDIAPCQRLFITDYLWQWRAKLDTTIQASNLDFNAKQLILALGIGRQDQLSTSERATLQRTGTAHLFAISGLHLTTLVLLINYCASGVGWIWPKIYLRIAKPKFTILIASLFALIYSIIVGFSLPIQRALLMLLGFAIVRLCNWKITTWELLQLSLFVFLVWQPGCVLLISFWLSFLSVGILIYAFSARIKTKKNVSAWWRSVWVAWFGTLGLNILFFQQISLSALLANAVAIPIVTLAVVPLVLIGMIFSLMLPMLSNICWLFANWIMGWLWIYLNYLAAATWASIPVSHYYLWVTIAALAAAIFYLLPRYILYSSWGYCLLFMAFFNKAPKLDAGEFELHVMDVGQGLATLIRTRNHCLLYDTGPRYMNYDMGNLVVLPYLHWLSITMLDKIIVSHWDSDHSGGLQSILNQMPVKQILSSSNAPNALDIDYCLAGHHWEWDGIQFRLLYPDDQLLHLGNNSSCVLQIQTGSQRVLLTGDIEQFAEKNLLKMVSDLTSQILIAPHHGSNTSSTTKFITAVNPQFVIFPVGWHNAFKLPHAKVLSRYKTLSANILRTDKQGAIRFLVDPSRITLFPGTNPLR